MTKIVKAGLSFILMAGIGVGIGEMRCLADETSESIQITTYYPSPYGSYKQLSSEVFKFKTTDGPPDQVSGVEEKGMLYFDEDDGLQYYDGHDWKPVASDAGEGSTAALVMNEHTEGDCVKAGGRPVLSGRLGSSVNQCQFTQSSCPVGWTQYKNWSTTEHTHFGTTPNYCCCTNNYVTTCNQDTCANSLCHRTSKATGCDTDFHAWADLPQETCFKHCGYTSCGHYAGCSCGENTPHANYAHITQIGCY